MSCQECERRARYMAADPEMYRGEDTRCEAHQPRPRPWAGFVQNRDPSCWADFHDWRAWLASKADCGPVKAIIDDCDLRAAVKLYSIMCELLER